MTHGEKWSWNRTAEHSAGIEIRCGGSGVACVFMCLGLAAWWWESSQPEEQLSLDHLQAEFISWCLALPFPATQTLLGNGFSCQKSVINTATGCGLNNRLMVIFLKELPAHGLHCPDMQCLSFLSGKGLFELGFCSIPHGICCLPALPATLHLLFDLRQWVFVKTGTLFQICVFCNACRQYNKRHWMQLAEC